MFGETVGERWGFCCRLEEKPRICCIRFGICLHWRNKVSTAHTLWISLSLFLLANIKSTNFGSEVYVVPRVCLISKAALKPLFEIKMQMEEGLHVFCNAVSSLHECFSIWCVFIQLFRQKWKHWQPSERKMCHASN